MCSFIILLLLLGNNCRRCGCNCGYDNGDYYRSNDNDYRCSNDNHYHRCNDDDCGCNDGDYRRTNDDDHCRDDNYHRDNDDNYRRSNDCDCGYSACEESASPIKEREDIWSSYMNTSSGKQY